MNKKRILAFLMAFAMMLSSFTIANAENTELTAEPETAVEETKPLTSEGFYALNAMGFLGGEMATTDAEAYITRAQFTGYLFKLAGYQLIEHKTEDIQFIDVNTTTPYYNEICTMCEMGIVNGTEPNMFSPNAHVTYSQACKLIVDVLGYRSYATVKYGEYPEGYVAMAAELEINEGVKNVKWDSELTAEDAVTMLYNAGRTEVMKFSGVDANGNATYETKGIDLFASNDIYYSQGIMMSNGVASLESEDVAENITIIDKTRYVSADVDLTNLLGCMVKYYYRDTDLEKKILWATEHERFNSTVTIDAIDLAVNDSSYSTTNVVYYDKNSKTDSYKVNPVAIVLYNNSLYDIPTVEIMKPRTGTMRLIDNNDDDIYDFVIIEEYYNVFVTGISNANECIIDKYGDTLDLSKYDYVKIIKDGKEIGFNDVPLNSVVSCVEDRDCTKIYIYVASGSATGQLKSIGTSRNNPVYTFETGSYRVSSTFNQRINDYRNYLAAKGSQATAAPTSTVNPVPYVIDPQPGRTYTYYLDMGGEIAEIQAPMAEKQYAFLMSAKEGPEYEDGLVYTRILLSNGSKITAIAKKKLIVDGEKENATEIIERAKKTNGEFEPQVVMIVLNEEGYLQEIDFATDSTNASDYPYGYNNEEFSLDANANMQLRNNEGFALLGLRWMLYTNTVVFARMNNLDDPEPYVALSIGNLPYGSFDAMVYDAKSDMSASVIYTPTYFDAKASWIDGIMMVDECDIIYDDGQEVRRVMGYCNATYTTQIEAHPGVFPADIQRGDMIRLSVHNNRVTYVNRIMTLSDLKTDPTPRVIEGGGPDSAPAMIFAPLYATSERAITLVSPTEWERYGKTFSLGLRVNYKILVQVYDTRTDEIYTADVADIHQIYKPKADGSLPDADNLVMVFAMAQYAALREVILVLY